MAQTAQNTVRIPVPGDAGIVRLFGEIAALKPGTTFSANVGTSNLGSFQSAEDFHNQYGEEEWEDSRILSDLRCTLNGTHLAVSFARRITEFDGGTARTMPSSWENEIFVTHHPNHPPSADDVVAVWATIDEYRSKTSPRPSRGRSYSSEFEKFAAKQLSGLADLYETIVREADEARRARELEFADRTSRLEEDWQERRKALDSEIEAKAQALAAEEQRLAEQKKQLDDRGHMHARRQLRGEITKDIKDRLQRPGVSRQTNYLRASIAGLTITGIAALSFYATYAARDFHLLLNVPAPAGPTLYIAAARFSLAAAGAFGLLMYLLGWIKNVHNEDVRSERDLERYRYDIDRASWAIETILEAQAKEGGQVPQDWIEGVTRNLFPRSESRVEEGDPLAALGSLLNVAAEAELGPAGTRIKIARRGLRQIGRAAQSEHA